MRIAALLLLCCVMIAPQAVESLFAEREFETVDQERRYRNLVNELRCLVCQNQSISESNSGLAAQLREEVHSMILDGKSDAEVIDFMVARYGDYVLFNPPVMNTTVLLWFGPFVGLGLALIYLFRQIRAHRESPS